jgi:hypothetical protein
MLDGYSVSVVFAEMEFFEFREGVFVKEMGEMF